MRRGFLILCIGMKGGAVVIKGADLRAREVINIVDGRRLGPMSDVEIDLEQGRVAAIVILGSHRFFGLWGRERDLVISWEQIVKVGVDVILVELDTNFGQSDLE